MICVRMTSEQRALLIDFSSSLGLNMSEGIRAALAACIGPEDYVAERDAASVWEAAFELLGEPTPKRPRIAPESSTPQDLSASNSTL